MTIDRRFERSERDLIQAFVRLYKTIPPEQITVSRLCKEAGISRYTFYAHYENMPDFYAQTEERVVKELIGILNEYQFDMDTRAMLNNFFSYVYENADVIFTVFELSNGKSFSIICDVMRDLYLSAWEKESNLPREQLALVHTYIINGWFALVRDWWRSGYAVEKEIVIDLFDKVSKFGLYDLVYTI